MICLQHSWIAAAAATRRSALRLLVSDNSGHESGAGYVRTRGKHGQV